MAPSRLEYLFNGYIHNNYTDQEQEELMALIGQPGNEAAVQTLIEQVIENTGAEIQMPDQIAGSILQNILQKEKGLVLSIKDKNKIKNKRTIFLPWMRVAAAAVLFLAGASYWIFYKKDEGKTKVVQFAEKHSPVLHGGDRAVLTMSDGSTIILDSMQNGTLQQGNTKVNKQAGLLIYHAPVSTNSNAPVVYNTLSTPRGGQYQVVLPDGSKVWLNAASSLHFPTAFTGNKREVELTGEAYFEVAPLTLPAGQEGPKGGQGKVPFIVSVASPLGDGRGMQVNVLGTHFNINAYQDEEVIKTSLLEGSVKITKGSAFDLLKPGQQAILNKKEDKIKISNADMEEVMAWKENLFQFEGSDLTTIMREIGRWYAVDVVYAGKIPVRRFEGKISRDARLSEVLEILKLSNVKFTVEGKKIIVQ